MIPLFSSEISSGILIFSLVSFAVSPVFASFSFADSTIAVPVSDFVFVAVELQALKPILATAPIINKY